ncbi:MAG TPA: hypothetical protein VM513_24765 [Kofleriaceae bacterium]|nr:hypothetical protein [Kofleriaceae bacterium]
MRCALLVLLALTGRALADAETDADRAFQTAMQRAVAGDPAAIDAFEALGDARPITRWTDDAWIEVARLAERGGDYARARRAYERVLSVATDERQLARARTALARLASTTGGGQWDAIAREHERLVSAVFGGDDPRAELVQLERIVTQHSGYPRVNAIRLALGRGWEEEGARARALRWWQAAAEAEPAARVAYIRALIRAGALDEAERQLAIAEAMLARGAQAAGAGATIDRTALAHARRALAVAERRERIAMMLWGVLALAAGAAIFALRRATTSWRDALRRLVHPPLEVVFLIPIAGVLVAIAHTGNPPIARAVTWIATAGVAIAWTSGVVLDAARARGPLGLARVAAQVGTVVIAVGAAGYLAVLRSGALDLLLMTWEGGHALR